MRAVTVVRVAVVLLVVPWTGVGTAAVADPGNPGVGVRPGGGGSVVDVGTGSPGSPGGGSAVAAGSGSSGGGGGGSADRQCRHNGQDIPCTRGAGWWSPQRGCYLTLVGDSLPVSVGATGAVGQAGQGMQYYSCVPPGGGQGTIVQLPVGAAGAGGGLAVVIDPEVLARSAVESMQLRPVDIGIVPEPGADSLGVVGLPVWLWVEEPGPQTWGPVTESVSLPGAPTVTATARVVEAVWDLGDGTRVVCSTPGTPYTDDQGDRDSPDCGHRYTRSSVDQPGEAYRVTVSTTWQVDWSSTGGAGGSFTLDDLVAETSVLVGELQVLVQ